MKKKKPHRKINIFIIIIIFLILLTAKNLFAQHKLQYSIEFNLGYNLIIPDTHILYDVTEYNINFSYLNFPLGISISFSTIEVASFSIDILFEYRTFTRHTIYTPPTSSTMQENFIIEFTLLHIPASLRIHLPLNLFIHFGLSMSFVIHSEFWGTAFYCTNAYETAPDSTQIKIINPRYYYELRDAFQNVDYSVHIGLGWKYDLSDKYYLLFQLRGSFSIIDIDKDINYETYLYSILTLISFGMKL